MPAHLNSCVLLLLIGLAPSTHGLVNTAHPAAVMPLAPQLGLFVADFDDTITIGDTTPLLPLIAAFAAPEEQKSVIENVWGGLTDSFLQSYYGALQTNVANHKEFTLEGFLLALEEAELASIHRVSDSKVNWSANCTLLCSCVDVFCDYAAMKRATRQLKALLINYTKWLCKLHSHQPCYRAIASHPCLASADIMALHVVCAPADSGRLQSSRCQSSTARPSAQ
jgi:hypothetical protein